MSIAYYRNQESIRERRRADWEAAREDRIAADESRILESLKDPLNPLYEIDDPISLMEEIAHAVANNLGDLVEIGRLTEKIVVTAVREAAEFEESRRVYREEEQ